MKKIFLRKEDSYFVYKHLGSDIEYYATPNEWKVYKLKESLIDAGADEDELAEILRLSYEQGYDSASEDCEDWIYRP